MHLSDQLLRPLTLLTVYGCRCRRERSSELLNRHIHSFPLYLHMIEVSTVLFVGIKSIVPSPVEFRTLNPRRKQAFLSLVDSGSPNRQTLSTISF